MPNVALYDFIGENRDELVGRCRAKVAKRSAPPPTEAEVNHGVPLFLDQLCEELRHGPSKTHDISKSAMEHGLSTDDFRTLNRCLDDAIAGAVTQFAREQDVIRDGESHELENLTNAAITAFEVLRTGNVGVGGSTGAVVQRNLMAIRDALVDRSSVKTAAPSNLDEREVGVHSK